MTKKEMRLHKAYLGVITILLYEQEVHNTLKFEIQQPDDWKNARTILEADMFGNEIRIDELSPVIAIEKFVDAVTKIRLEKIAEDIKEETRIEEEAEKTDLLSYGAVSKELDTEVATDPE